MSVEQVPRGGTSGNELVFSEQDANLMAIKAITKQGQAGLDIITKLSVHTEHFIKINLAGGQPANLNALTRFGVS